MLRRPQRLLSLGWLLLACSLSAAPSSNALWKAGVARANITPEKPLWLAGYASRDRPADGKVMDLWIKTLALEDQNGHRAVILTSDTLGIPQSIYQHVTSLLKERFGLRTEDVILSASHTHCGPVLRQALYDMYPLDDEQRALIESYSIARESNMVETVGQALADLSPARIAAGLGTTSFAVNRRNNQEKIVPQLIEQGALKGPVDHGVPTLAVFLPDGKLKAVLFGYACHNTVMDFYKWSGDYAGFAQLALEKSHPNATALFFIGCGGDQNPLPRRQLELAERYGNMLAAAVEEVLLAPQQTLPPQLKTSMEVITLQLGAVPTPQELAKLKSGENATSRRWATRLLDDLQEGKPLVRACPYPIQAWQFGGTQLLVTLGGETVVDYAIKFKKAYGPQTWIAGYCNDVMTYIPSTRVLKEGDYEGGGAMIPYGLPAWRWADDIEDLITASVERQIAKVRGQKK